MSVSLVEAIQAVRDAEALLDTLCVEYKEIYKRNFLSPTQSSCDTLERCLELLKTLQYDIRRVRDEIAAAKERHDVPELSDIIADLFPERPAPKGIRLKSFNQVVDGNFYFVKKLGSREYTIALAACAPVRNTHNGEIETIRRVLVCLPKPEPVAGKEFDTHELTTFKIELSHELYGPIEMPEELAQSIKTDVFNANAHLRG